MAGGSDARVGQTLILLAILCAAGGWNYHRNAVIDAAVPRPYRGYSDEELNQLISAYQAEVEVQMERYRKSTAAKKVTVQDGGLLEERIDEFERIQRHSKQRKERAYQVTENQILVEQLAQEQVTRELNRPIYKMIFRRLTTF
jgi:restriction endonuclease